MTAKNKAAVALGTLGGRKTSARKAKSSRANLVKANRAKTAKAKVCGMIGEPEAGRMVCELPPDHEGYHRNGPVTWLGYYPKTVSHRKGANG